MAGGRQLAMPVRKKGNSNRPQSPDQKSMHSQEYGYLLTCSLFYIIQLTSNRKTSKISQKSFMSGLSGVSNVSAMSGLSEVSVQGKANPGVIRRTTQRIGKRVSLWMGYRGREDSVTHGLYNDFHFSETREQVDPTEQLSEEDLIPTSGNIKLKLTYLFMFIEWLIFCAIFIQFMSLLPDFFKLFTHF